MPGLLSRRRPLPKPSPESDPRFRKVMEQLKRGAAHTKSHAPASKKAGEASAAAKGPPTERLAAGKAKQVDKIEEAPTKKPEASSFLAVLQAEIAKAMPKTLADTETFMKGGSSEQLKGSLKGNVAQQKDQAEGGVKSAEKEPPKETGTATAGSPIPAAAPPGAPPIAGSEAMPAPKADADVSLQDSKQDTEQQMKEADVTETQLKKANDPRFSSVLTAKDTVAKQADAGPGQYRAQETHVLSASAAAANVAGRKGAGAMAGVRGGSNSAVLSRQAAAKARDEAKRKEVVDHIEEIYNRIKTSVEGKLNTLETEVGAMFDGGIDAALNQMTNFVEARIDAYKDDRYSGLIGKGRWIRDKFKGLPDEANAFYVEGRALFTKLMNALVVKVAAVVEQRLKEAKDEVAKGQAEIKKFVASQPKDLQEVAKKAQQEITDRFSELEHTIDDKKQQIAESLAQKYKEGFDKANEALKKIQDANKGLIAAFVEKLKAVIEAIIEFKNKLVGILRKGADAIRLILADPIGFLGNLLSAIKQGFSQFASNIWTHLKAGFMKWIFGALAENGIEIPTDLTLPSILKLVLGVLGITYERIRAKAVRLVGERAVKFVEKVAEYIKTLFTGGFAALWEKVKEDLGNLKEMVIDAIQDWLITTIIKRAVAKVATMFNPVGAIVQAILAIVDVVIFVVEKANQILEFISAVVESIGAIAMGQIAGAANWIERALGNMVPLLIGFLAQLLGLGGISKKIKDFITRIQDRVDRAIDKAVKKIVAFVRKLVGGAKDDKPDERTPEQKKADLEKAVAETKALPDNKKRWPFINLALRDIKSKYRLTELTGTKNGGIFEVQASINPSLTFEMVFESEMAKAIADDAAPKIEALGPKANVSAAQAIVETAKGNAFKSAKEAGNARMIFEQTKVGLKATLATKEHTFVVGIITNTAMLYVRVGGVIGGHPQQELFRNRVNDQIYVAAANNLYAPRYVTRNISERDVKSLRRGEGMSPRDPKARIEPLEHVIGSVGSPFISTSTKPDITNPKGESFNKFGQRRVDLSRIAPDDIINLSTRAGQKTYHLDKPVGGAAVQALADVQRTGEILIRGTIPQEAIL